MNNSVIMNFLAVFAGVILSFSLWFLGEYMFKWRAQRKDREAMIREIVEEAKFNILILNARLDYLRNRLNSGGDLPLYFSRLRISASRYAISSGNVRLLKTKRKQLLVRYMNELYERENSFAENTELIFATLLLRPDGLQWVDCRLERIAEDIPKTISLLTDFLNKFQQKNLPEDKTIDDWLRADVN